MRYYQLPTLDKNGKPKMMWVKEKQLKTTMIMNNVNEMVSPSVANRAKEVVSELLGSRSANITEMREEVSPANEEVFEHVKTIMAENNPSLSYGCSHSDGRFWLND